MRRRRSMPSSAMPDHVSGRVCNWPRQRSRAAGRKVGGAFLMSPPVCRCAAGFAAGSALRFEAAAWPGHAGLHSRPARPFSPTPAGARALPPVVRAPPLSAFSVQRSLFPLSRSPMRWSHPQAPRVPNRSNPSPSRHNSSQRHTPRRDRLPQRRRRPRRRSPRRPRKSGPAIRTPASGASSITSAATGRSARRSSRRPRRAARSISMSSGMRCSIPQHTISTRS